MTESGSVDMSIQSRLSQLDVEEADAIRLLLSGGSVIDWHRAHFTSHEQVSHHLAKLLLDWENPAHRKRVNFLFREAVTYLEEHLSYRVPKELRNVADVRDIFLFASDTTGYRRQQMMSCVMLKLMYVLYHLESTELRSRAAISERRLLDLAHNRVTLAAVALRQADLGVVAFYGNRKTRSSVITKLLSKRETVAATIFDKLRYRVVVRDHSDLVGVLKWLVDELVPFHQVIPEQSHNNLLHPSILLDKLVDPERADELQSVPNREMQVESHKNEFSGASYRMINFIVDLPVHVPEEVRRDISALQFGHQAHVLTEFQVVDQATAITNEQGENAHGLYKERQLDVVRNRLQRGNLPFGSANGDDEE